MLNKVLLIGRLTRDPEIRFLSSGMQVTIFTLAVNRRYKDREGNWQQDSNFFDVEAYGNLAERLGRQLSKGHQIFLEGSLKQDKWENSAGEKKSKVKIVAEKVSLLSKPASSQPSKESHFETDFNEPTDLNTDDDVPF
jgi:single-strand DNA-binding protein